MSIYVLVDVVCFPFIMNDSGFSPIVRSGLISLLVFYDVSEVVEVSTNYYTLLDSSTTILINKDLGCCLTEGSLYI